MGDDKIAEMIQDVWSEFDDFEEGGFNYVAFVILQDLREMEESDWEESTCTREMTDVIINAVRAVDELTQFDVDDAVDLRLKAHRDKDPKRIIDKYQRKYQRRL